MSKVWGQAAKATIQWGPAVQLAEEERGTMGTDSSCREVVFRSLYTTFIVLYRL